MGLTYHWWLESGGKQVRLGPFPVAQVYRRDDWGWQFSYQNAVCCSIITDAVPDEDDEKRAVSRKVERVEVARSLPAEIRPVAPIIRTGTSSGSSYGSSRYMAKPHVSLNEDVLSRCLSFLDVKDVQSAALVAHGWAKAAEDDSVWEPLCEQLCATKALKYRLTPAFKSLLALELPGSWKLKYKALCIDGRRSCITKGELMANTFDFTFRFQPNIQTSRSFTFGSNGKVSGHPMGLTYNWWLEDGGKQVRLGPFPVAQVHRREDWGWTVCYQNAVCCSVDNEPPSQKISTCCGQEAAIPYIGDHFVRRSSAMLGA